MMQANTPSALQARHVRKARRAVARQALDALRDYHRAHEQYHASLTEVDTVYRAHVRLLKAGEALASQEGELL